MSRAFSERVVVVTGGSTGIGAATALRFANEGARVLIVARSEEALATSASSHREIAFLALDLGQPDAAVRLTDAVAKRYGRLDVLVNNAAIAPIAPLPNATPEHVRSVLSLNVEGLIATTRLALPLLRASQGSIVNIATVIADEPLANMSVYCASKAAVLALTRAWAQELAADGIRVNVVSPGCIETSLYLPEKLGVTQEAVQQIASNVLQLIPTRRFGKPEEVAAVVTFLASNEASYVTGAEYTVGGGLEA